MKLNNLKKGIAGTTALLSFGVGGLSACGTASETSINKSIPVAVQERGGLEWADTLHYIFAHPEYFQSLGACATQLSVEAGEIEPNNGGAGMGFDYLSAAVTASANHVSCSPNVPNVTLEVDGSEVIVTHDDLFPSVSKIPTILNN
jgi:hypothetical protein